MKIAMEETNYSSCPVCKSSITNWRTKKNKNKLYNIDICGTCHFAFVNPRPSFEFLMDYYQSSGLEPGIGQISDNHITLDSVVSAEIQDPNSTIDAKRMIATVKNLLSGPNYGNLLDVGSGYGFFSKEAQKGGFKVSALELGEIDRAISQQLTGLNPVESSFEDFKAEDNSFSVVLMSQILEHALDINAWMEKTRNLLELNGIVIIALPNFGSIFRKLLQEKEPFITPPTHLNFFNLESLSTLLKNHGFEVKKVQYVSRLSKKAIERRTPVKPLMPIVKLGIEGLFKVIDYANLGMIINVYAKKI